MIFLPEGDELDKTRHKIYYETYDRGLSLNY